MICASEAQEFVPFGRKYSTSHPGNVSLRPHALGGAPGQGDHGLPIVKALKDISIRDTIKDSWKLRSSTETKDGCDEELYIHDHVVVWSRGLGEGASKVIKSFSMDTPVQQALWCSFLLPADDVDLLKPDAVNLSKMIQHGVCVLEANSISIFTTEGKDYVTALPFQVSKCWGIQNGLLFERDLPKEHQQGLKTPKRDPSSLPVLFSMLHPLDEVAPVIYRTGGSTSAGKVSFVTEPSQQIIFISEELSLVVTYDKLLSTHSVWTLRRAKLEEACMACGSSLADPNVSALGAMDQCSGFRSPAISFSASGLSRLTRSSHSPSMGASPVRTLGSRVNSPAAGPSRINSPSLSRLALSRSNSPGALTSVMDGLHRLQTPSPAARHSHSPGGALPRTPVSNNCSFSEASCVNVMEPLAPEICLDLLWSEGAGVPKDGAIGRASKVFITQDLCGQRYLAYLVNYRHHLRCVKFDESNDRSQLIFGAMSLIQARDAIPLQSLDMMLVLDMNSDLMLYSGITKVHKVHVSGLPSPLSLSHLGGQHTFTPRPSTPFSRVARLSLGGPVTSSRPPSAMDARFDDELPTLSPIRTKPPVLDDSSFAPSEGASFLDSGPGPVQLLSPVPTEFDDSSQALETSFNDELSLYPRGGASSMLTGLRDPVDSKFTLELTDGSLYRTLLPQITGSPIIKKCLEAVRLVLPKDVAMQVVIRWYSTHNAPGSFNGQSEWCQFTKCLLSMMGYDTDKLPLAKQGELDTSLSHGNAPKKPRPSDQGTDEDWEYLCSSDHYQRVVASQGHLVGLEDAPSPSVSGMEVGDAVIETSACLFCHMPATLFALHLVYEELKVDSLYDKEVPPLGALLCQLARDLRCDLYVDHYCRDQPQLFSSLQENSMIPEAALSRLQQPGFFCQTPPSIYQWLYTYLRRREGSPFPYLPGVSLRTIHLIAVYVMIFSSEKIEEVTWSCYLRKVASAGHRRADIDEELSKYLKPNYGTDIRYERVVLYLSQLKPGLMDTLVQGIAVPVKEAIFHCRNNPPGGWPETAYRLIGREDLAKQIQTQSEKATPMSLSKDAAPGAKGAKDEEDGMEYLDKELLKLRFSEDLRIQEVRRLLQSARPVRVAIQQRPEVSDHDFIEEQQRYLYSTCIRTMALPLGRGMFTLSTYHAVPTETLPIPKLCLTGRAPPRNATVDLTHIETPPNMTHWPQFHNGVAAGLRIAHSSQLDTAWILYNKLKSNEMRFEHAGFLMGLGLNGHLKDLATLQVHDYLVRGHEMTSVGLLLGISAGKRGTMDATTTKLLSIHLAAFLPPTSTELDVAHNVQVAAVLGLGLVYQATAHRHVAEVLLKEIGRPPGPEMENSTDRESYCLACGLALGLVMLQKGSGEMGLSDLGIPDQLYHYMIGGHRRSLSGVYKERYRSPSYQIQEGDCVNVDVTSPGATLALGMMFFKSNNSAVAEWLRAPDTQILLDFVRPDFLMLRILSRGLVLWDYVTPCSSWINSNLPEIVAKYAFNKLKYRNDPDCDIDFETMSQAYCNIIAGASLALGLKFAGSANQAAFNSLFETCKRVVKLMTCPLLLEQAGKSTVENCLVIIALSLAMVMAGTGNLEVLRLCRCLRARVGQSYNFVLYGSHMNVSMAIGLLFLGGGRYTLSTRPESVAAMLCAFFPKFPIHSNDNRYHLQAFRHLYVLAAEPRVLIPKDVDSGLARYVPLDIIFENTQDYNNRKFSCMAPCILPELSSIREVKIRGPRYKPICFQKHKNWDMLNAILSGSGHMFVKQRAGHLSYSADPQGYHSVLLQSLTGEPPLGRVIKTDDIKSFSSDPRILAFAEFFCSSDKEQDYQMRQFLSRVLYECVSQEKLEALPVYMALQKMSPGTVGQYEPLELWQLKLMAAFYERQPPAKDDLSLISLECIINLQNELNRRLSHWSKASNEVLLRYFSGQALARGDCDMLAAFLTWFDVLHPALLGPMGIHGRTSFPQLYKLLQPSGLSVTAIMALASALQHTATTSA